MESNLNEIKVALITFIGVLTGFWGWLGWLVVCWVCCMVLDYITGSAAAGKAGEWESRKAMEGIYRKFGTIVVVMVSGAADLLIGLVVNNLPMLALPVEYGGLICPVVLVWYIVTELGSITENAVSMGAPVPALLTKLLKVSKDAVEQIGGDDD